MLKEIDKNSLKLKKKKVQKFQVKFMFIIHLFDKSVFI